MHARLYAVVIIHFSSLLTDPEDLFHVGLETFHINISKVSDPEHLYPVGLDTLDIYFPLAYKPQTHYFSCGLHIYFLWADTQVIFIGYKAWKQKVNLPFINYLHLILH